MVPPLWTDVTLGDRRHEPRAGVHLALPALHGLSSWDRRAGAGMFRNFAADCIERRPGRPMTGLMLLLRVLGEFRELRLV